MSRHLGIVDLVQLTTLHSRLSTTTADTVHGYSIFRQEFVEVDVLKENSILIVDRCVFIDHR